MIKRIKTKDKQLNRDSLRKILKNNNEIIIQLRDVLKGYTDSGFMLENESRALLSEIKQLDGIQQKAFYTTWFKSGPKSKYTASGDEQEEIQSNLLIKWYKILRMSRNV